MPNWVTNVLNILDCTAEQKLEIMRRIQEDDLGLGTIDFNKIIPMPQSLDVTSGSIEDISISFFLTAKHPNVEYFGQKGEKLPLHTVQEFIAKYNAQSVFVTKKVILSDDELQSMIDRISQWNEYRGKTRQEIEDDLVSKGDQYIKNLICHGATTWYNWRINNWGTKWNATNENTLDNNYSIADIDRYDLVFRTAWSFPRPCIEELSRMYPEQRFKISWHDEGIAYNSGHLTYKNGQIIEGYTPDDGSEETY